MPLPSEQTHQRKARKYRNIRLLVSVALAVLFVVATALLYSRSLRSPLTIPGLIIGGEDVGGLSAAELQRRLSALATRHGAAPMTLAIGKHQITVPHGTLGVGVDLARTVKRAVALGKSGDPLDDLIVRIRAQRGALRLPLATRVNRRTALAYMMRLKRRVDRAPVQPRLDLKTQSVLPGRAGYRLALYDTLARLDLATRAGRTRVELFVSTIRPKNLDRYRGLDISHVMAQFHTVYALTTKYRDRSHNLKVGAAKLDGYVLRPGETMSYNQVVGPRNKAQGYRTAPVISQGELVDGMAGGSCQLSSTLFAASFFAGLGLESSRPHTMPSSYIKMGLDATVVYPSTDLKIKNTYDFPVVIHFTVSRGRVRVRILGKKRPYRKIVFRRTLKKKSPFKEIIRDDPKLPRGVKVVAQAGVPGVLLERERLFFMPGKRKPVKVEKRELRYPPTTRIVRRGTGPRVPDFEPPKSKKPFGGISELYTLAR